MAAAAARASLIGAGKLETLLDERTPEVETAYMSALDEVERVKAGNSTEGQAGCGGAVARRHQKDRRGLAGSSGGCLVCWTGWNGGAQKF